VTLFVTLLVEHRVSDLKVWGLIPVSYHAAPLHNLSDERQKDLTVCEDDSYMLLDPFAISLVNLLVERQKGLTTSHFRIQLDPFAS
jgi:hypothetical protein